MEKTGIILAGLPGDMATRINTVIGETDGVYLSSISGFQGVSQTHPFALTGYEIKGKLIDNEFKERYLREKGIRLISPDAHHEVVKMVGGAYGSVLAGISFTTPEGYLATGKLFAENRIPFVLGGTGAIPEQEKELEEMVLKANIPAVIDKNMGVELVLITAALRYLAENFPGALKGRTGFGIDSHQKGKKDPVSGTLVTWHGLLEQLGVDFYIAQGDRTSEKGHGFHILRTMSPSLDVNIGLETQVVGRDAYAYTTVQQCVPFLREMTVAGKPGIYKVEDVLRKR